MIMLSPFSGVCWVTGPWAVSWGVGHGCWKPSALSHLAAAVTSRVAAVFPYFR